MPSESFTMIHKNCRAKLQYISKQIDNNLISICPRLKVQQIIEITTQKNEKYLPEERNLLAWQPARLLASCQLRNFLCESTEKCFIFFRPMKPRNSSHVVLATPIFLGMSCHYSFYGMTSRF